MSAASTDRLAANIRAELARRGLTQRELAQAIGMREATLSGRLAGTSSSFRVDEVDAIAGFLRVPLTVLYGEAS